jgi:hypothetical protein
MRIAWLLVVVTACGGMTEQVKRWPDHRTLEESRIKKLEATALAQDETIAKLNSRIADLERAMTALHPAQPTASR